MKIIGIIGAAAILLAGCTNPNTGQTDPLLSGLAGAGIGAIAGYAVGQAVAPPQNNYYYSRPPGYYSRQRYYYGRPPPPPVYYRRY